MNRPLITSLMASTIGGGSAESSAVRFQEYARTLLDKMEAEHLRAVAASRAAKKKSAPALSSDRTYVTRRVAVTDEEIARIMSLHREGRKIRFIVDEVGRAENTVRAVINRNGREALRKLLSPAEVEHIERLASEGYSIQKIAEIMGRPLASVHNRVREWKLRGGRVEASA